jgi:hypothetical protein
MLVSNIIYYSLGFFKRTNELLSPYGSALELKKKFFLKSENKGVSFFVNE